MLYNSLLLVLLWLSLSPDLSLTLPLCYLNYLGLSAAASF